MRIHALVRRHLDIKRHTDTTSHCFANILQKMMISTVKIMVVHCSNTERTSYTVLSDSPSSYVCHSNTEYTAWDTCNQSMNNRLAYYQCKLSVYMIRIISTVYACLPRRNRCSFKLFAWLHTTSRTSSETSHQHLRELLEWHHNAITNSGIGERDCYHTSAKWGAFGDFVAIAFYFIIFQCSKVSFIEK